MSLLARLWRAFWCKFSCMLFFAFIFTLQPTQAETFKTTLAEANVTVQLKGQSAVVDLGVRKLPWKWDAEFPRQAGIGHFTVKLNLTNENFAALQADGKGIAFSALSIGNRYRFRLNSGNWQSVGWDEATTQYRSKPRWHVLRLAQLKQSENTLELELRLEPANDAGLSVIDFGDVDKTFKDYQWGNNIRHFGALIAVIASTLLGFLALAMWFINKEKIFALAGFAEIFFAIRQTAIFVDYPFISTWIWNAFFASLFALYVGFICQISSLLIYKHAPRLVKLTQIFLWLSIPILSLGYFLGEIRIYRYWLLLMLLISATHLFRMLKYSLSKADLNLRLYTAASLVAVALGLYDFLYIQINLDGLGKLRLSTFSALLFNLTLAVVIVRKFLSTQYESNRARLDAGIQQEKAKHGERQRIMKELHDSVGSHLVGLLGLIKGGAARKDIESLTTDTLQELRIAVDAMQPVNGNLAAVLATLRHRLQPSLEAMHIKLIWRVDDLPKFKSLTPLFIQNIQRILLEAFANVMHHSKATTLTFSALHLVEQNLIQISMTDDGVGFDVQQLASEGQGLTNMFSRAEALGATVQYQHGKIHGSCMILSVPVV
jgi:signal transduction histidine kinase